MRRNFVIMMLAFAGLLLFVSLAMRPHSEAESQTTAVGTAVVEAPKPVAAEKTAATNATVVSFTMRPQLVTAGTNSAR